jgi:hypothetical protein
MKKLMGALLLLVSIVFMGCSHIQGYLDIATDKGVSKEYLNVLNRWTKSETVYSQFETNVRIAATLKSKEFNDAYLKEYARLYQMTAEAKDVREATLNSFLSDFTEIFFYVYIPEQESNDFDKQNSIWTIFLSDEKGNRISPIEVRRIEKVSPVIEAFYPYINRYYGFCYYLKFPPLVMPSENQAYHFGGKFKLVFTSVLGKVELQWP